MLSKFYPNWWYGTIDVTIIKSFLCKIWGFPFMVLKLVMETEMIDKRQISFKSSSKIPRWSNVYLLINGLKVIYIYIYIPVIKETLKLQSSEKF
jgi:hypothetical protein